MYPLKIKEKYNQNDLENLWYRFSVPYLWTYIEWDFREYSWSHPWVDIIPEQKNQEIFSILDSVVYKTWEDWAYWKYVFLEHKNVPHPDDLSRTTTLYSCYEHLSEIKVKEWDVLKEWDVIWKTWTTWNSFGEHLHFQIDRQESPFHAYWPFTGAEAKAAWTSFSGWVNMWLWIEKAKLYTVNPLVYLDKVSEYKSKSNIQEPKIEEVKTQEIKKEEISVLKEETIKVENVVLSSTKTEEVKVEEVKKEEIPIVTNNTIEKLKTTSSDENIIVTDPSIDFLSSLSGDKKKL